MSKKIIKGNVLMLFLGDEHACSYALNHTLTCTTNTIEITSKDHGMWPATEVSGYSWEITTENLFTMEEMFGSATDTKAFNAFEKWAEGRVFKVKFGVKAGDLDTIIGATTDYWTLDYAKGFVEGYVIITSLTMNANNGDNATYNATLKGVSKLEYKNEQTGDGESNSSNNSEQSNSTQEG